MPESQHQPNLSQKQAIMRASGEQDFTINLTVLSRHLGGKGAFLVTLSASITLRYLFKAEHQYRRTKVDPLVGFEGFPVGCGGPTSRLSAESV